jgi:hypothetical protein
MPFLAADEGLITSEPALFVIASGDESVIVWPSSAATKTISSSVAPPLAPATAAAREPGPESAFVVTVNIAALAGADVKARMEPATRTAADVRIPRPQLFKRASASVNRAAGSRGCTW